MGIVTPYPFPPPRYRVVELPVQVSPSLTWHLFTQKSWKCHEFKINLHESEYVFQYDWYDKMIQLYVYMHKLTLSICNQILSKATSKSELETIYKFNAKVDGYQSAIRAASGGRLLACSSWSKGSLLLLACSSWLAGGRLVSAIRAASDMICQ